MGGRTLLKALIGLLAGAMLLCAAALVLIQLPWAKERLRHLAEDQAQRALGADVTIGRLRGNLLTHAVVEDVRVTIAGAPAIELPRARVDYDLFDLVAGRIAIARVQVYQPIVRLARTMTGELNLARLGTRDSLAPRSGPGRSWSIRQIIVEDGRLTIGDAVVRTTQVNAPDELANLTGVFAVGSSTDAIGVRIDIDSLSFETRAPRLRIPSVAGGLVIGRHTMRFEELSIALERGTLVVDGEIRERTVTPVYDLRVETRELALANLASLVPALTGYVLSPSLRGRVRGAAPDLSATFIMKTAEGDIAGDLTLDLQPPARRIAGEVRAADVDLVAFRRGEGRHTDLTGTAHIDLSWTADAGTVQGTFDVRAPELAYDLYEARAVEASGRVAERRIDLRVISSLYGGRAEVHGFVTFPDQGPPAYRMQGTVEHMEPSQLPPAIRPDFAASVSSASSTGGVTADIDVQGIGPDVSVDARLRDAAIAGARFSDETRVHVARRDGHLAYAGKGIVNGLDLQRLGRALGLDAFAGPRFASDIDAAFEIGGSGTTLSSLTLDGDVHVYDSFLFNAYVPVLTLSPNLARGAGAIGARGRFSDLELEGIASRLPADTPLQGTLDAEIQIHDLSARDGELGILEIRSLDVHGPDSAARFSGTLALDRTGASSLEYFVDTPRIEMLEAVTVPIRGEVAAEGRVTGNLARFVIAGRASATAPGYGRYEALSAESTYRIELPDLQPANVAVDAHLTLTAIELAGRTFETLTATAGWVGETLTFDAEFREAGRSLDTKGRVVWRPERQELFLERLTLAAETTRWTLAADAKPYVAYGGGALRVSGVALVSPEGGEITAHGELGTTVSPLLIRLSDVRLDGLDGVLVESGVTGAIDATARITGTWDAPIVRATVDVEDGTIQGFSYQRFAGNVSYEQRQLRLDVRLQRDSATWLTAVGRVPTATDAETLDLRLASTPIDLAVVQTVTNELADVTGQLELDVRATGSVASPRLSGFAKVVGGAFTIVAAQSRYTGFDTYIDLQGDVLTIQQFELVDDEDHRLQIGGRLALRGRRVDDLDVQVRSSRFEISDNRFAELEVGLDLRVSGELLRPRITGEIALASGRIRVDRILGAIRQPYELPESEPAAAAGENPGAAFRPTVAVTITIPDTLVLAGTDLRAGGAPVGLGDINLTIGGNLELSKQPAAPLALTGEVQTVRGTYEFQGRQFELVRGGSVAFVAGPEVDPLLDITATRTISAVLARVHIGGRLRAPRLELSSDPPLEQAQILSLIVFNQPIDALGTGAQLSLAERAAVLASGFLTSPLSESVGEALELDVFELQAQQVGGTLAPMLTIGEQFGDLYLRVRQRFGPESLTQFILEYAFNEWLRVQSTIASDDSVTRSLLRRIERTGLDLIFRFSY